MKKNIIILIIILAFNFVSCSKSSTEKNNPEVQTLKIYRPNYDHFLGECVKVFKQIYPNVNIVEIEFESFEEYSNKLFTHLMAGEGPDVLYINLTGLNSFNKLIESGAFYNLNEKINSDKEIHISDYNKNIFDYGNYGKSKYFIPVDYIVPMFWSYEVKNSKNDTVKRIDYSTYEEFKEVLSQYSSNKYIFGGEFVPYYFILSSGLNLVDYENRNAFFETNDFIKLLKMCKYFYDLTIPNTEYEKYKNQNYDMIKNDLILFDIQYELLNPFRLAYTNSSSKDIIGKEIELHSFPNYYGKDTLTAIPYDVVAINNNSKSKDSAYEFAKVFISSKMQKRIAENKNVPPLIPVNNKAIFETLEEYRKEVMITAGDRRIPFSINENLVSETRAYVENLDVCQIVDRNMAIIINEEVNNYLIGKTDEKQAAKLIQQKVLLYLNE